MRTTDILVLGLITQAYALYGQIGSIPNDPGAIIESSNTPTQNTPYTITERGSNTRVWQRTNFQVAPSGQAIPLVQKYIEVATGLCYKNQNGEWADSQEIIVPLITGGAAATNGQHQVYFPWDIYSGSIVLITPDKQRIQCRPLGVSYSDGTNTVLISELTNSVGQILNPGNQVIYTNAFTDFKADLVCTYRKGGFESEIVFRQQLPEPESVGLNSARTRLQLWTEFFQTAAPAQMPGRRDPSHGLQDTTIAFGRMKMAQGEAFLIGEMGSGAGIIRRLVPASTPVFKTWTSIAERQFLIEEAAFIPIRQQLRQLQGSRIEIRNNATMRTVLNGRAFPAERFPTKSARVIQTAQARLNDSRGVVLDFNILNSDQTNFTFSGDSTYQVSGEVNLEGTTTIEGGAVIKFPEDNSALINCNGPLVCRTGPYRPGVLTSTNDSSVGAPIPGSTGTPRTGSTTYLWLTEYGTNSPISYLRFAYAGLAFADYMPDVTDCQFVGCNWAIDITSYDAIPMTYLKNVLFGQSATPLYTIAQDSFDECQIVGVNVTAAAGNSFYGDLDFTNSIFANFGYSPLYSASGVNNGFYNTPEFGANAVTNAVYPFRAVGGGNYYLANSSQFISAGTTNIAPNLLADLRLKTTLPPEVLVQTIVSSNLNLSQGSGRDIGPGLSLGYHYDALDYAVGFVYVTNAVLSMGAGTSIATFSTNAGTYAIGLAGYSSFTSQGLANSLNHVVEFSAVQEQPVGSGWGAPTYGMLTDTFISAPGSLINSRFTDWSVLASDAPHLALNAPTDETVDLKDSQFHGGDLNTFYPSMNISNCLLERVYTTYTPLDGNLPFIRNNLFWNGSILYYPFVTNASVKDNFFDHTAFIVRHGQNRTCDGGYNGYVTNCARLYSTFSTDVILPTSPTYQTGPLGSYYQPTNSVLINAGSTTADQVELYHYTVTANLLNGFEIPETNSIVDIGYHYVATDANGNPIDTNGDGIPDYLQDANGNGFFDIGDWGEWQNSPFGLSSQNALQVFTPLK